ncbi:MAG: M20/M25/M40 family metallo-hydrolase [Thermoanaerobaculia bacterium]
MRRKSAGLALLAVIVAAAWLAVALVDAPEPVPATAPEAVFSAERALPHVEALAGGPRPIGTEAHARARRSIQERLRTLGLEPIVQVATGRSRWGRAFGTVRNVLVRLPGTESAGEGPAVLLMAHYDSVPQSPGASDDAVGVAVLLETLRALRAGPPLRHDVIALFSDGEEAGLLGAEAFVHDHPWAEDVALVLNFEARGTRGPALMFETGGGNRWVVERFAGAPHPVAASYSYEVYRRLPNDTDFSIFRGRGVPGLNFAHIHGPVGYHTARDTVERLDPASLQHHGANALALARAFGDDEALGGGVGAGTRSISTPWERPSSGSPRRGSRPWWPLPWSSPWGCWASGSPGGACGSGAWRRGWRSGSP